MDTAWLGPIRQISFTTAHTLPLSEAARAHALMEQGGVGGKIVLVP